MILDFPTCLKEIVDSARLGQLSLWVGSGMSRDPPSALPSAKELKFSIVERICDIDELRRLYDDRLGDGKDIGNSIEGYPLEAFIELICETQDVLGTIAELFRKGYPNRNHTMIAKLVKDGLVREILTTNFDLLIERAFEQMGWSKTRDFEVYYTEDQFSRIDFPRSLPTVFKIHGSADEEHSMRVTLSQVAGRVLSQGRARVLEHFLTFERGDVLILGYSASDDYDINPVLSTINPKKRIFFVSHMSGEHEVGELPQPFSHFSGYRVICDTNDITECLRRAFVDGQ